MNDQISSSKFLELASVETKRFSVEAFTFTFQFGLNIYFDDMDDFKKICNDIELEFWLLSDSLSDIEVEVNSYDALNKMLSFIENLDEDNLQYFEEYKAIVRSGSSDWDEVENWRDNNIVTDFIDEKDFGIFLVNEMESLNIPAEIEGYFDYEAYGRDCLQNSYLVINKKVYHNC